jgi:hypothetical protein
MSNIETKPSGRPIIDEDVVLDENGKGQVKYLPIIKNTCTTDWPVHIDYETGVLSLLEHNKGRRKIGISLHFV